MFKFEVDSPIIFELSCTQTGTQTATDPDGHEYFIVVVDKP